MSTDSHGNIHDRTGRFSEKQHTVPGPAAALTAAVASARASTDDLERRLASERTRLHRLEAAQRLSALSYPDDHTVDTVTWHEEPNGDGTFDVDFCHVYDAEGNQVDDIGGQVGAVPAGTYTFGQDGPVATDFDLWREDPDDPDSDIALNKVRTWVQEQEFAGREITERDLNDAWGV